MKESLLNITFEEFYHRFWYMEGEEEFEGALKNIRPGIKDGEMPGDFKEYLFTALSCFWDAYHDVCKGSGIKQEVEQPWMPATAADLVDFTNDKLLFYKKEAVRALMSVFSQKNLFRHNTVDAYLDASDEEKLNIAEVENEDPAFQLLLIEAVGVKIDFENMHFYFNEYWPKRNALRFRMRDSANPWLAGQVAALRANRTEQELRAAYAAIQQQEEGLRWQSFLCEAAIREAIAREPVLATRRDDMELPERTKQALGRNCLEVLADIVQLTEEMLRRLNGLSDADREALQSYLGKLGYPPVSSESNPFIIFLPEYH